MDLQKLFKAQTALLDNIVETKGLNKNDLLQDTYVALQVELAEFANEGRWFKYWSENQEPRTNKVERHCSGCMGLSSDFGFDCAECERSGFIYKNPLLEEYADSLHFFLQIAILKGWEDSLYLHEEAIMDLERSGIDGGLTGIYLELMFFLIMSLQDSEMDIFGKPADEYCFSTAWFLFIGMGMIGFGFTLEQIEQAYFAKNEINHERQSSGY